MDDADLRKWTADFGALGGADGNGDGRTDGADLLIWQRQLGASDAIAAVPESTSISIAVVFALATFASRYRGAWR